MVGIGVLSLDEALRAIDFDTIALLLGMMIVVGNLRLSGLFRLVTNWVVTRARHPLLLLAAVILTSGLFSAFLVNDTICLALTPLVLDLVLRLRRDPVPYLLAVAMASNVGSVATITGNPQNIMIGSFSRIPYGGFAALAVAGRGDRAGCDLCPDRAVSSGRVLDPRAAARRAGAGPRLPAAGDQSGGGDLGDDGRFFCRSGAGQAGAGRRLGAAGDPHGAQRQDLPRDRLAAPVDVRRPVHRRLRL